MPARQPQVGKVLQQDRSYTLPDVCQSLAVAVSWGETARMGRDCILDGHPYHYHGTLTEEFSI